MYVCVCIHAPYLSDSDVELPFGGLRLQVGSGSLASGAFWESFCGGQVKAKVHMAENKAAAFVDTAKDRQVLPFFFFGGGGGRAYMGLDHGLHEFRAFWVLDRGGLLGFDGSWGSGVELGFGK